MLKKAAKTAERPRRSVRNYDQSVAMEAMMHHLYSMVTIPPYVVNDQNREVISLVVAWACNGKSFEHSPLVINRPSLRKGITLAGNVGGGKSIIMSALGFVGQYFGPEYEKRFVSKFCQAIATGYKKKGPDFLEHLYKPNNFLFDELGYEKEQQNYEKEPVEVMADVIMYRDMLWNSHGTFSLYTTNLSPEQLKAKYGERAYSRLLGHTNLVYMGADENYIDWRKWK